MKYVNAISKYDKQEFIKIYNISKNRVIVNGMGYNKEVYNNIIPQEYARRELDLKLDKFIILFHGFYFINNANKEAFNIIKDQIAPQIKNNSILFLIAGKMPNFRENIKFLGFVDDLKQFLYAGDIAIIPIFRGSGVRIKMIDYLSAKIPMITTRQAVKGLEFKNNLHVYFLNDNNPIDDLIEKIIELEKEPKKVEYFKNNIIDLLEVSYNWNKNLNFLAKKYKKILKN